MSNKTKTKQKSKEIYLKNGDNKFLNNCGFIKKIDIKTEMEKSFLSYAMSVIVSRALPEIKDGLKPVQRRILYGMKELGVYNHSSYKKAARIVGDVMGKFHPHGDSSIYEAMVRMAQNFNYRYPLVDGHGNFGSIDGDAAAAMRYTEVRMSKIAMEMIKEIEQNTIDFVNNYDNSEKEPIILPTSFPNLLINGCSGIAVGMATNIPSHNLGEVIDAVLAYIENKNITITEIMKYIKGPDFPTGGEILGSDNLKEAYETGRGKIYIRAKTDIIKSEKNRYSVIITEIPYQIKKTSIIERIAFLAKEKIIDGITDLRDESSNKKGIRIVIDLRKDVNPKVFLNNLYKHSQIHISYNFNMIALVNGIPQIVNLKKIIQEFFLFRIEVINRQKKFELKKAADKKHLIEASVIVLNDIDNAIELIKKSENIPNAKEKLIKKYNFDEIQSKAILEMSLQKITNLEIEKIKKEEQILISKIAEYESIINSQNKKEKILKKELLEIKKKFQDKRKTIINKKQEILDIPNEDLIEEEHILITVTNKGYAKRLNLNTYKKQNKGGKGVIGITINEDDFVEHFIITSTHDYQLFFTNKGKVYQLKGYQIPVFSRQSKGIPLINLIPLEKGEFLTSLTSIKNFKQIEGFLVLITKKGLIKRNAIQEYENIRVNGKIAFVLKNDDEVLSVLKTSGNQDIILAASNGKAIRFNESSIRKTSRMSTGIIGMRILSEDNIIGSAAVSTPEQDILVLTEFGYGKKTKINEYRKQKRGGKGTKTLKITSKNGKLVSLKTVLPQEDLILISDRGKVIRMEIDKISTTKSKVAQGNKLFNLDNNQKLVNVVVVKEKIKKISDL
ncbi:DNA gyrase, A subunit [Candidatus Phytoplasma oryzae]|uniref:DNA gyrase subunit A n=1 Tax=Candidatus Phytoplasma oryzae TaxID=203274 RepID=A0A139JR30_9MOLU|nr:DNA gyrase subunit A [Candidatus Phytoplasma oryzae]KXT29336.1 DNA gyrase, A subunit [Candidatus Phytoplasma oryzae]RAM57890.1 DNA gyrase subunit A [Candidatus Phytoplasma oryzae]